MSTLHIFQSTRHASALALLAFIASSGIVADAQQPGPPVRSLELDSPSSPVEALRASEGMIEDNDMFRLPAPPRTTADRKSATQPAEKSSSTKTSPESISAVKNRPLIDVVPEDLSQTETRLGSLENAENNLNGSDPNNGDKRPAEGLLLSDVIASVYRSYPEVAASRAEFQRTNGELTSAYGSFDTKLKVHSLNEPLGVFENYRHGISVARQTWWGGYVSAGYRIGRGIYAPWYLERETDKGGEFKLAYRQSLLQGLAIDPQRVAVFQADLDRRTAGPQVQLTILDTSRDAALAYWKWVSEGTVLEAQRELLELAEMRNEQFEVGVKAGKFPEIDLILNTQLVAERQAKLLQVQQKFREAAFKLSLFLRDDAGEPMVPQDAWLPKQFPVTDLPLRDDFDSELYAAIERRPEFALLQLKRQQLRNDRSLAYNQMQPKLDFIAEASQDIGEDTSSSDNKDELLVFLGVEGELPIQLRKARGKIQSTTAKIAQLNEKVRLQSDKVAAELRTGYASLELYAQVVEQADLSLRAAFETLDRYRFAFTKGKADLIVLNLVETKAYETEIKLIESQQQWFRALAELQASLGLDPLTQAGTVDAMPASDRPGPGNPPTVQDAVDDDRKPAEADDEADQEADADAEAETPNE